MTSRSTTAAVSAISAGRASPNIACVNGTTLAPVIPYWAVRHGSDVLLMIDANSLAAADGVAPGASRAMAIVLKPVLPVSGAGHGSQ